MLPEKKLCDGFSAPCTRIPGEQHGISPLLCFRQVNGTARHQDDNGRLSDCENFFHQDPLRFRKKQVLFVTGEIAVSGVTFFPFQRFIQAQHEQDDVAVLCHGHGFGNPVIRFGEVLDTVAVQSTSFGVKNTAFLTGKILNAFQHRDIAGRRSVIVPYQGNAAVGIRSDDAHGTAAFRIQRKQAVVLQQHAGLQGGLLCQIEMLFALYCRVGNIVIFASLVSEDTEQVARGEQADSTAGDVLFRNHPKLVGMHDMLVGAAAVQVAPGFQRLGDGFNRC